MAEERAINYLTFIQVVKSFMSERGEKTLTNFQRYLQMAIEIWSDMNIFTVDSVNVAYLDVNQDSKSAQLPVDFVTMTKIGFELNGVLWTLTQNRDMILPPEDSICNIEPDRLTDDSVATVSGGYYFAPHYRYGRYITTLYGTGGGFNVMYYRIDMKRRVIYFDGRVPTGKDVIMEYKSNGVQAGNGIIPREAAPALKAGLHWKMAEYDSRIPMNEKIRKENLYDKELYKLKLLDCSFTMQEFLDNQYSTMSQGPKR